MLVGFETSDDAGVYRIGNTESIVQSIDVITPVVDDPYSFGRIAAINSLSDIYAMGANPETAMALLMYNCDLDEKIISLIMQGACDELRSAECVLVGGHTVNDNDVKFGLSVTGTADNGDIIRNNGLNEGDALIYTKPLGIGIMTTALKNEKLSVAETEKVTNVMLLSNYRAAEVIKRYPVSACTDITGYGFGGHAFEMAKSSECSINFSINRIPVLEEAPGYAEAGIVPGGAYQNKQFLINRYMFISKDVKKEMLMFDPQTSGGLMIGIKKEYAWKLTEELKSAGYENSSVVGEVTNLGDHYLYFRD